MTKARSTSLRSELLIGVALCSLAAATVAHAQASTTAPAPASAGAPATAQPPPATNTPATPPPAGDAVSAVSVVGQRPPVSVSADAVSFSVANDVTASAGSLADVLRKLPAVTVDLDGNLALRGDGGVQIQVDGKPSPLFASPARGQLLLSTPAKDIDRIEISTTPSAANSPEGAGGIINIVMKKQATNVISSGQIGAQAGTLGDKRVTANYSRKINNLTLAATGAVIRQHGKTVADQSDSAGSNPATALNTASRRIARAAVEVDQLGLNADYNAGPNHLVGNLGAVSQSGVQPDYLDRRSLPGSPSLAYVNDGTITQRLSQVTSGLDWTHKLSGDNHDIEAFFQLNRTALDYLAARENNQTAPTVSDVFSDSYFGQVTRQGTVRLVYRQPTALKGALRLGAERVTNNDDFHNQFTQGGSYSSQAQVPGLSFQYHMRQNIDAAYATWQAPFGKLSLMPGLRVEHVDRTLSSPSTGAANYDKTSLYPTLNFTYNLDPKNSFRGGFSQRVTRPAAGRLQPVRSAGGTATSFNVGNPRLDPERINAYELGYQYRVGQTFRQATVYWRDSKDEMTQVSTDLGNGTTLNSWVNLGSSRAVGLDLSANGPLGAKLNYNLSANLLWKTIDATALGFGRQDAAFSVGGSANFNWTPDPKDTLQLNAVAAPKVVTAQGYMTPYYLVNLGWRRTLTPKVTLTFTARDLFNSVKAKQVVDTPNLRSTASLNPVSRGASLQLNYTFGQTRPPAPPTFDYSGGSAQ